MYWTQKSPEQIIYSYNLLTHSVRIAEGRTEHMIASTQTYDYVVIALNQNVQRGSFELNFIKRMELWSCAVAVRSARNTAVPST